jgi:hypothetical protein
MQIKKIFDIIGPNGVTPNGWNYNYTNDFWDYNFIVVHDFIQAFNKNYVQVPVYDCNLNISEHNVDNKHISEIYYNETQQIVGHNNYSELFIYTIHPFGSIDTCLGRNLNYHQNSHCFDFISQQAKFYIRNAKNFYLVFDYSSEGDIKSDIFDNLHSKCKELDIPPSKVLVITSAMNTRTIYEEYLKNHPEESEFYTAYYCWPLLGKRSETRHILQDSSIFEFNGHKNENSLMDINDFNKALNRNKKCLIFNRRIAPHRLIILSLLANDNLLDKTDYSIDLDMSASPDVGMDLAVGTGYNGEPYIKTPKVKSNMMGGFMSLNKIKKKTIDFENISDIWGFGFENKQNYLNTYFSVITETIFYEDGHYISEKSFKGIAHMHPFVIIGKPGILKYLKSIGFKTFSDFWDESYDEMHDNSERMEVCYELIKSLILKTNDEWDELNQKLLPILEHNRNHILSFEDEGVNEVYIKNLYKLFENEPNKENYFLF